MRTEKVIKWSQEFAYAIGLLATDGNLSPDGRHIHFMSKDKSLVEIFCLCMEIDNKIGRKGSGSTSGKNYFVVQFSNIALYKFLNTIGLTTAKSKTIADLKIPKKYYFDFLRGCIDGDGNISVTKHPESTIPQLRLRLCSASKPFLIWNKDIIHKALGIESGWLYSDSKSMHVLSYGKRDSVKILKNMYHSKARHCLDRKYQIALPFIR